MIIQGDAYTVLKRMDDECIHMAVTSSPYYGLRSYGTEPIVWDDGWKGELGQEPSPEMFVRHLTTIFHELKRVLRKDGVFWMNIGDSYSGSRGNGYKQSLQTTNGAYSSDENYDMAKRNNRNDGDCKPKDLIGIPWMLAFSMRADGWYLRSDIPWVKRNSLPSSVTDRPGSSIEHVFLFSKSPKYYYDHIATMQPSSESYNKDKRPRGVIRQCVNENTKYDRNDPQYRKFETIAGGLVALVPKQDGTGNNTYTGFNDRYEPNGLGLRYMRDSDFFFKTWQGLLHNEDGEPMALVVNPKGYKGSHFASYPIRLCEPLILAGTSGKGVCPKCSAPWVRVVKKKQTGERLVNGEYKMSKGGRKRCLAPGSEILSTTSAFKTGMWMTPETVDWKPTCTCNLDPIPATVLDPFSGSSATGVACKLHNRTYIGIELNPEYVKLGEQRIKEGK